MSRQSDLAIIDTAILAVSAPPAPAPDVPATIDPILATETPEISEGQARYLKEQREQRKEAEAERARLSKEQEAILEQQEALLGKEEADRLRAEQEAEARKSAVVKAAQSTVESTKQIVHAADVRLGSIPTPGSIALPLLLLIFIGFILIQYNGMSKLQWLWSVLTNNAYIGGGTIPNNGNFSQQPLQDAPMDQQPIQTAQQVNPALQLVGQRVTRASAGIREVF